MPIYNHISMVFIIPFECIFIIDSIELEKYLLTKLENFAIFNILSILDNILKNISIIHIMYITLLNFLKNIIVSATKTANIITSIILPRII